MKTNHVVVVSAILSTAIIVCVAAPAPTKSSAARPASATNSATKAQAAQYKTVKTAASRFDEMFVVAPATAGELRSAVSMMVARGATVSDLGRFYNRVISDLQYIVSSAMTARAESPEQHARYRCIYAQDLLMKSSSAMSVEARKEAEAALKEAGNLKLDAVAYLASSLGACVYGYTDGDIDKSWEFFKQNEELLTAVSGTRGCYFGNIKNRLVYGTSSPRMSNATISQMKTYVDQMLLNKNLIGIEKYDCEQFRDALSRLSDGDLKKKDQAKKVP